LLILTTIRRLVLVLFVFLAWAPAAYAWSWPVQGPVAQPFVYDEAHPYASGQHRGIDIGADAAGEAVVAPAAGTVSFAGTVPTNGKTVTIETADGYSVTLTHLGSIAVSKGAAVAEQDAVGTVGPSGTPELAGPYVHLGIRVTTDPNGYLDPLGFLPPLPQTGGTDGGSTTTQPNSSTSAPPAPASKPASPAPKSRPVTTARRPTVKSARGRVQVHEHVRAQAPRTHAQAPRSSHRPAARTAASTDAHAPLQAAAPQSRASEQPRFSKRPVVEPAAPGEPAGLDAGHEIRGQPPAVLVPAFCNGLPALLALAAALAAARGRRRRAGAAPAPSAPVLHLPRRPARRRPASRAA
jgi:hypothetical protein